MTIKSGASPYAGYFTCGSEELSAGVDTDYVYVDRDVTITGSGSKKYEDWTSKGTFNYSLKKGWNIEYEI